MLAGFQSLRYAPKRTVCETGDARPKEGGRIAGLLQRSGGEKWSTQAAYRQRVVALRQGFEKAPLARELGHKTGHNPCPRTSLDTSKALC